MERQFTKELWILRFQKMLALEKSGANDYQQLLDECEKHELDSQIISSLNELISDEKRHTQLVSELIEIANRQIV